VNRTWFGRNGAGDPLVIATLTANITTILTPDEAGAELNCRSGVALPISEIGTIPSLPLSECLLDNFVVITMCQGTLNLH
jgi:hypothetical protein